MLRAHAILVAAGLAALGLVAPAVGSATPTDFDAAAITCSPRQCLLHGGVRVGGLGDPDRTLWADEVELELGTGKGTGGAVVGARARGDVLLVEPGRALTCASLYLDGNGQRGGMRHARLALPRPGPCPTDRRGQPLCRSRAIVGGDVSRDDAGRLSIGGAHLTLCDCGPGALPSWRLVAPTVEIGTDMRALVWWPRLEVHVPGLGLRQITPPLPPVSLPLTPRAAGLLPPEVRIFSAPYPTVDLPLFLPLGPHADLTVALGVRTDWGAPRAGARLRYAAGAGQSGCWQAQLTYDVARAMARGLRPVGDAATPDALAADRARRALGARIEVHGRHRGRPRPCLALDLDLDWASDDLVPRDLGTLPDLRYATYLPSRLQLAARTPGNAATLAADAFVRLDAAVDPLARAVTYSNLGGAERATVQRGPALRLAWLPIALPGAGGVAIDGQLDLVRYGPWSAAAGAPVGGGTIGEQAIGGATLAIGWARRLRGVNLDMRVAAVPLAILQPAAGADRMSGRAAGRVLLLDLAWTADAAIGLPLVGRVGPLTHLIVPALVYRALPHRVVWGGPAADPALDERLVRRTGHQAELTLRQTLWRRDGDGRGTLALSLPADLARAAWLSPRAELSGAGGGAAGRAWGAWDPRRRGASALRELGMGGTVRRGPGRISGNFERLAPDAERFARSIYELAAPAGRPMPPAGGAWVHLVRGEVGVTAAAGLDLSYAASYQLPRPEATGPEPACSRGGERGCFVQHVVTLGYDSPCACWGLRALVAVAPQERPVGLRVGVSLSLAGIPVGVGA